MRALEWCHAYGVPVIVLTATLDSGTRNRIIQTYDGNAINVNSYPSITYVNGNNTVNVRVKSTMHKTIHIDKVSRDDLLNDVIESIHDGGNAAVIVNTVSKAQELYDKMLKTYPDMDVQLFHSRFTIQDRTNIEHDIINKYGKDGSNRPERSVVISTQVIEQSLDLDFDIMYTDVAPIDLIIQRSGRLHRHNHHVRQDKLIEPILKIIDMPDPMSNDKPSFNGNKIYGRYRLMKAVESLQLNEFTVPDSIIGMMNQAYDGKMSELDSSSAKWRETMNKSYSDYAKDMNQSDFIIDEPMKNSALTSMTEKNAGESDDDNGRTAVRSGISSINVIAMYQNDDGSFSPIYYDGENHHVFITDDMAFDDEMILYKSRVSLPFECSIHDDEIMRQLDKINESIPEWDATKILSNEFALIFNDDGYAEIRINGETRRLKYDCKNGLNMIGLKS